MPVHETLARRVRQIFVAGAIAGGVILTTTGSTQAADCSVGSYLVQTDSNEVTDAAACIQTALTEAGYDSGPVDGWFGPVTEGAVSRYQMDNGLTVDGQVGAETAGHLGVWSNDAQSSDSSAGDEPSDTSNDSNDASSDDSSSEPDYSGGGTVWDDLAQCESGGDWSINTGNGYYGGLQFLLSTWQANGGSGYPHENSREEQIRVAENLRAQAGFSPWPSCASQLGLL